MKPSSFLGLDLGTSMGFARQDFFVKGGALLSGTWDFKPTRFDSPSLRYTKFGQQLDAAFSLGVDKVFYEKVLRHRGTTAAHVYGAFLNKLHEKCDEYGVEFEGLSVQEIKRFATGKGNASKDEMVRAAKCWGFNPTTEDEADAIAILKCGVETKL